MESIGREPRELGTERRALLARDVPDLARREARRRAHHGFQPCAAAVWHLGKLDRGGGSKATDPSYLSFTHRLGCIIVPLAARLILQGYDGGTLTVIH